MALLSGPNCVIEGNSSDPALRVTQTGTGPAIRIEDSTTPDATPFVVTLNGDVGIKTAAPLRQLQINEDASNEANLLLSRSSAAADEKIWRIYTNANDDFAITAMNDVFNAGQDAYAVVRGAGATINYQQWSASGNIRMRLNDTGVSVGSNSVGALPLPTRQFQVYGATEANILMSNQSQPANDRLWRILIPNGSNAFTINASSDNVATSAAAWIAERGTGNDVTGHDFYISGSSALSIDSNGNVGIGTTSPIRQLVITEDVTNESNIVLQRTTAAADEGIWRIYTNLNDDFIIASMDDAFVNGENAYVMIRGAGVDAYKVLEHRFTTLAAVRVVIDQNGNISMTGSAGGAGATNAIQMKNGTPTTATVAGGGTLYVDAGALKFKGGSGTVTTIAPA